jgi:hypothetical protein
VAKTGNIAFIPTSTMNAYVSTPITARVGPIYLLNLKMHERCIDGKPLEMEGNIASSRKLLVLKYLVSQEEELAVLRLKAG